MINHVHYISLGRISDVLRQRHPDQTPSSLIFCEVANCLDILSEMLLLFPNFWFPLDRSQPRLIMNFFGASLNTIQ